MQYRKSFSTAGKAEAQFAHCHARARHENRREPGHESSDGSAVHAGRPYALGSRQAGSDRIGRQHREPTATDVVRHRPPGALAQAGHTGAPRLARR